MKNSRVFRPLIGLFLPLLPLSIFAQGPVPQLGKGIDQSARVPLPGSRSPYVSAARDLQSVSPDMAVPGITLVFRRSGAQEAALQGLLAAQQNPKSPLYRQWLNPETFAARFGVADSDLIAVERWLTSYGFHVDNVARSRDRVTFSGIAAQVSAAFGTELRYYQESGELHFAPATDLTLPVNLAPATLAVLHLSDFRPKPAVRAMAGAHPDLTSSTTQAHYLTPKDILTMYDAGPIYAQGTLGAGQGLAIVGQSFVNTLTPSSVDTFQMNLTQYNPINPVLVPNSGPEAISPGDEGESEIDLEYSSGIAQNSNVFLVYVGANQNYSVFDALAFAISEDIAPVVSISYGACEPLLSSSELDQYDALFEEASAQGQTLVASSGDSGSTACAPYGSAQGVTLAEQQALTVNFPASSPHVTAVGGTQMAAGTFTAGSSSYWASAPNAGIDVVSSLLSYVPEVAWNEGSPSSGIVAGGGGTSAHYARPTWQSSYPGIPAGNYRLVPDIALQSSIASPGFLVCSSDAALIGQEGQTSSCASGLTGSNHTYTIAGGTSFAAPIFAGFIAILNELENATGQGNVNPVLYSLAANANSYAAAFHDITSGSNACVANSGSCVAADESSYLATTGFDEATGLGSIDLNALTTEWPPSSTAGLLHTIVSLTPSSYAVSPGQTNPIQINVGSLYSSNNSVPTGSVSVSVDGQVVDPSLAFSSTNPSEYYASVSYNFVAPTIAGSHLVSVGYPGDSTHAPATATYPVLVGSVLATGGMTLNAANLTVTSGSTGSTQVTVTPSNGYEGRVVWSLAATGPSNLSGCYSIASLLVNGVSTTNLTIGLGKACTSALPSNRPAFQRIGQSALVAPHGTNLANRANCVYALLLMCGCLAGARRRSRLSRFMVIGSLLIVGANVIACGGGSNSGAATNPPPSSPTTYTLKLTGTDSVNSSITATTTFILTVN